MQRVPIQRLQARTLDQQLPFLEPNRLHAGIDRQHFDLHDEEQVAHFFRRGTEAIGFEEGQLLIKCVRLETLDRNALQERLKNQDVSARVTRRAIWLEIREGREWREDLAKTLEMLR